MLITIRANGAEITLDLGPSASAPTALDDARADTAEADDPSPDGVLAEEEDDRPKCCDTPMVQGVAPGGGPCHVCIRCGDVYVSPKQAVAAVPRKKHGPPYPKKPCCGSVGTRHKAGCPSSVSALEEYECDTCKKAFLLGKDASKNCPECGSDAEVFRKPKA